MTSVRLTMAQALLRFLAACVRRPVAGSRLRRSLPNFAIPWLCWSLPDAAGLREERESYGAKGYSVADRMDK